MMPLLMWLHVMSNATPRLESSIVMENPTKLRSDEMLVKPKTNRGQDAQLFICSCVAEKPGGCLYKLAPDNAKFHLLFKSYLYL